jgi:hypothetical protein
MESRIFLSGGKMDLFTLLAPAPLSVQEIAEKKQYLNNRQVRKRK